MEAQINFWYLCDYHLKYSNNDEIIINIKILNKFLIFLKIIFLIF